MKKERVTVRPAVLGGASLEVRSSIVCYKEKKKNKAIAEWVHKAISKAVVNKAKKQSR